MDAQDNFSFVHPSLLLLFLCLMLLLSFPLLITSFTAFSLSSLSSSLSLIPTPSLVPYPASLVLPFNPLPYLFPFPVPPPFPLTFSLHQMSPFLLSHYFFTSPITLYALPYHSVKFSFLTLPDEHSPGASLRPCTKQSLICWHNLSVA